MQTAHIGTDIIEISRIRKAIKAHSQRILNKIFTKREQEYCLSLTNPYPSFAARFAAKEAVAKALGTGIGKVVRWKDIEILKSSKHPEVYLPERVYKELGISKVLLSISHSREYATAVAVTLI
ncbi:holo-ACP synthase [Chlamydia caviae]|uniref:Holo-[acyl-carrier-protein] synthase n=1 Tax=Chlamydia caviae (strain ATCC VR-813 / DSM 19441 / 03DC25 / GPIC) TaxID=227941 RepID=ACPS_CHLCV|nr:holo-ACP synthase [Chlamydia caviae]Q820E7.1 RecName: Full=Holo-[acyl-carrier-protein] synthase; Short=Holo-ACP synthase; AltName: Full=4'-phosphopantetheinyl transferase AcpS [Chlamydia caviae GPIC]AAP05214.1 holo-(acyl-carrier protein) synthase [Chlamydia caviae GPIC]